jgi:lysophospholipase L1-like esterase
MNILFLGDSLIEFYDWEDRFPLKGVANLGIAGESVLGLLSRLEGIIKRYPSAGLIFIMTGINNIAMEDLDFFTAYREIIERLKDAFPGAGIYINSLLPVIVDFIPDGSIRKVNDSLKGLSADTDVGYLDVYGLFMAPDQRPVREYLLDDGVHLSGKGYEVWSKALEKIIRQYGDNRPDYP